MKNELRKTELHFKAKNFLNSTDQKRIKGGGIIIVDNQAANHDN